MSIATIIKFIQDIMRKDADYGLDFKNLHRAQVENLDSNELLAQYHAMQAGIARLREGLKNAVGEVLASAAGAGR